MNLKGTRLTANESIGGAEDSADIDGESKEAQST